MIVGITGIAIAKLMAQVPATFDSGLNPDVSRHVVGQSNSRQKISISETRGSHCHMSALMAYVVKGTVEVVEHSGGRKILTAGQAFIEANDWMACG